MVKRKLAGAGYGLRDWAMQRATAVLMLLYTVFFFFFLIACITNAGPALGSVGPAENYSALSSLQKWLLTTVMLLGRLEIFTVFMLFTPGYWKK